MSLLNISNKFIIYNIFFHLPVERRLKIINCSKAYYNKLEYLPITKKMYNKITIYMNHQINEKFKNYRYKESFYKILSSNVLENIIANLKIKYNRELSTNFQELIKEIFIELLKSKNIYLLYDYLDAENYKNINKFFYHNNIINFNDSFYKILNNELKNIIYNNNKIFGIAIQIRNIDINNLDKLNEVFNNIHFLLLDFSDFFNNFNDLEMEQIFNYLDEFAKKNSIEIFFFNDDTERTLSFIENFQKFTEHLYHLNKFYMNKYFKNRNSKKIIKEAFKNDNEQILSLLEDPNLILHNYLKKINNNINILNLNISNPCSINGDPGNGSFISLATGNEDFSIFSKFQNLEELVLLYDWPGEYYYGFGSNSLINSLNSIKTLKNVIFKENDYLLKALSSIKVENAYFINTTSCESEVTTYYPCIIETEMLNNIKNIEIKIASVCEYKNKILKYDLYDGNVDLYFNCDCEKMTGLKYIDQLIIKIRCYMQYNQECQNFTNLILNTCKQNNHLKKIIFNYICYDLNGILEILYNYCSSNDTLKNIELTGKVEVNDINRVLDYILKVKEQKVDIVVNILENEIKETILNNQNIIKGKLYIENFYMQSGDKNYYLELLKIK